MSSDLKDNWGVLRRQLFRRVHPALPLATFPAEATVAYTLAYAADHRQLPRFKHVTRIITLAAGYGIVMELGQHFLPHRTPFLITDVLVNTLGASLVICWFLVRPHLELQPVMEDVGVDS